MNYRRDNVPFDPYYFEKQASNAINFSLGDTFRHIYQTNHLIGAAVIKGESGSSA